MFKSDESPFFDGIDRLRVVFVDGVFDADASDNLTLEGVEIERLAEANADIHWAKGDLYGVLEATVARLPVVKRPLRSVEHGVCHGGGRCCARNPGHQDTCRKPGLVWCIPTRMNANSDAMLHHVVRAGRSGRFELTIAGKRSRRRRVSTKVMEVDDGRRGGPSTTSAHRGAITSAVCANAYVRAAWARKVASSKSFYPDDATGRLTRNEAVIEAELATTRRPMSQARGGRRR